MTKAEFEFTNYYDFGWESDLIDHIYYNEPLQELWVILRGGRTYAYNSVSPTIFESFVKAPSAGGFYNYTIRGRYIYSLGFKGLAREIKFIPAETKPSQKFDVTVSVTVVTTRKVTIEADSFDDAEKSAIASIARELEESTSKKDFEVTKITKL